MICNLELYFNCDIKLNFYSYSVNNVNHNFRFYLINDVEVPLNIVNWIWPETHHFLFVTNKIL